MYTLMIKSVYPVPVLEMKEDHSVKFLNYDEYVMYQLFFCVITAII